MYFGAVTGSQTKSSKRAKAARQSVTEQSICQLLRRLNRLSDPRSGGRNRITEFLLAVDREHNSTGLSARIAVNLD
ncbi:hypothetical protein GCM10022627_09090 [Haloarcula argentinensis]